MNNKRAVLALKVVLWLAALAPGTWLVVNLFRGELGPNPIETLTHWTGMTTLVLLLVTLGVTPFRRITGWNPVIRLRRPLGLFAFFYGVSHFSIWYVFDQLREWDLMVADVLERPYITVGMTALVVMTPLALTSTKWSIRKLGKKWTTLHKSVYLATALGVVHYFWLVKADTRLPIVMGAIFVALMVLRAPAVAERIAPKKKAKKRAEPEAVEAG